MLKIYIYIYIYVIDILRYVKAYYHTYGRRVRNDTSQYVIDIPQLLKRILKLKLMWLDMCNRGVSQMRELLVACREILVDYNTLLEVLYDFEHKTSCTLIDAPYPYPSIVVFWQISNIPPPPPPHDFTESNLLWYLHILYSSNICEILPYHRQLVVITCELIYIVWAAHH